jgi:hypothetical protein
MANFYDNLSAEDIEILDKLSMLLIELKESRLELLERHKVESEPDLLTNIKSSAVDEHPSYEDYLGAKIIDHNRENIRTDLRDYMLEIK